MKSSFLSAAILLTRSLREEYGSQRYKFTQIPELILCLLVSDTGVTVGTPKDQGDQLEAAAACPSSALQDILKEEPNFLCTFFRQKVILVVVGLR